MRRLMVFVLILIATACRPAAPPPTVTLAPTTAPAATATPLPTRAPLPTPIPTVDRSAPAIPPQEQAHVRVVHAAPEIEKVDVYLDAQVVAFNMDYGDASTRTDVPAGAYVLRLLPAGGRIDTPPLLENSITLAESQSAIITVLADESVQVFAENVEPLATTESRVQVINTIFDSPRTTIDREDGTGIAFDPIGFGEQSQPFVFTAEDKQFTFENLLQDYDITLRPNRTHTMVLMGTPDEPFIVPFDVTVPAQAALTFVNLSDAVGEVDVYLNSERIIRQLGFREDDDVIQLPTGAYEIAVYDADVNPETVEPLLSSNVLLNPDDELFMLLMGGNYDDLRLVTYAMESTPTAIDETRIAFVHAVPDVLTLTEVRNEEQDIVLNYGQPLVTRFPAETRDFEFVTDLEQENYTIVDFVTDRPFEEGTSYLVLLTGTGNDGAAPIIFEQPVGTEGEPIDEDAPQNPEAYLINAIDRPVQVIVDGILIENELLPQAHTDWLTLNPGRHDITIADPETREPIYSANRLLQADTRYTLVLFGDLERENYLISEFPIQETSVAGESSGAMIRVINVSLDTGQRLSLGYGEVLPPDGRPTNRISTREALGDLDERIPLPTYVVGFTNMGVASGQGMEPIVLAPQSHDLYIYGANTGYVMAALYNVGLEQDAYYDLIVSSQPDVTPFSAFVVRAP